MVPEHIKEMLRESKLLNVRESNIVDGVIGLIMRLSEASRSTMTTDDGAEEIVVYRAMREGIDDQNAPSLLCDVTNRESYASELKKTLKLI